MIIAVCSPAGCGIMASGAHTAFCLHKKWRKRTAAAGFCRTATGAQGGAKRTRAQCPSMRGSVHGMSPGNRTKRGADFLENACSLGRMCAHGCAHVNLCSCPPGRERLAMTPRHRRPTLHAKIFPHPQNIAEAAQPVSRSPAWLPSGSERSSDLPVPVGADRRTQRRSRSPVHRCFRLAAAAVGAGSSRSGCLIDPPQQPPEAAGSRRSGVPAPKISCMAAVRIGAQLRSPRPSLGADRRTQRRSRSPVRRCFRLAAAAVGLPGIPERVSNLDIRKARPGSDRLFLFSGIFGF